MSEIIVSDDRNILDPRRVTFDEREQQRLAEDQIAEEARKRKINSPFNRWTQYNNEHTKEMMWLARYHPIANSMLLFLVDQMDNYNAVMCSYQVLQEVLDISKDTVRRNLKLLKENGYIAVLKSGTSNVYTINHDIYWKSYGNNKQYSKFPANVVLSMSEQEAAYELEVKKYREVDIQK